MQPRVKEDGDFIAALWFDETRLEVIDDLPVIVNTTPNDGPDKPAPRK